MWKKFKKKVEEYAIWLMLIIPLGAMVIWNVRLFANNNSTVMNVLYGFISTLIGALIGGFCSLAAAIYAGDQQVKITIKHDAQVKLRDTYSYHEICTEHNLTKAALGCRIHRIKKKIIAQLMEP